MNDFELEGRLRSAAATYERLAPAIPDLERRILARIAVTPREDRPYRGRPGRRSWAIQLLAAAAVLAFAVAVAFLIREARLFREPQPVTTPSPSPQSLSVIGPGGWKYSAYGLGTARFGPWVTPTMVTPTIGWQSPGASLTRTTDGGAHWMDVTPPGLGNIGVADYLDATHAWIAEEVGNRVITFRTADGGRTWQQGAPITPITHDSAGPHQLEFVDPSHGWLLLSPVIGTVPFTLYRTNDGGLHWQLEAVSSTATNRRLSQFGCDRFCLMAFASPSTGWVTSVAPQPRPSLLVTHDGGATWKLQTLPLTTVNMGCPCYVDPPIFSDQDHGTLMLWSEGNLLVGHLLVTSDRGSSWTTRSLPGEAQLLSVGFYDASHRWVIAGLRSFFAQLRQPTS